MSQHYLYFLSRLKFQALRRDYVSCPTLFPLTECQMLAVRTLTLSVITFSLKLPEGSRDVWTLVRSCIFFNRDFFINNTSSLHDEPQQYIYFFLHYEGHYRISDPGNKHAHPHRHIRLSVRKLTYCTGPAPVKDGICSKLINIMNECNK